MTNPLENKFTIYRQNGDKNSKIYKNLDLAHMFQVFPEICDYEMLEPAMRRVASYSRPHIIGQDGTMMRVFEERAVIQDFNKDYAQWRLYTEDSDIRTFFAKNLEPKDAESGAGESTFEFGLDTDNLGPRDVIIFEDYRDVPILIKSHPDPIEANVFAYEGKLINTEAEFINFSDIQLGKRIIQIGSLRGEAAIERGNVTLNGGNSYVEFEAPMTEMGWQMKVTDKAWKAANDFVIEPSEKNTEVMNALTENLGSAKSILHSELEQKFFRATNRQIDMWLTYGRSANRFSSEFLDGLTERNMNAGPGLYEYLESAHRDEYPVDNGNLDIFRNFLKRVWHNKVNEQDRVVDVYTGSAGLELVQKWCRAEDIDAVHQTEDLHYTKEGGYFEGRQGVVIGKKQYIGFYIEPFGLVRFHHLPFLDSSAVETRMYKNYPISSYQFLIFDFGYGDVRDDSNIAILRDQQEEQFGVGLGSWGPFGGTLNGDSRLSTMQNTLGKERAYEYIRDSKMGFIVKDTSSMLWLQPAIS